MFNYLLIAIAGFAIYLFIRMELNTRGLVEDLQSSIWDLKDELRKRNEEFQSTRRELKLALLKETGHERFISEMTLPQAIKYEARAKEVFKGHGLICNDCGLVPDLSIEEAASELNVNIDNLMSDLHKLEAVPA